MSVRILILALVLAISGCSTKAITVANGTPVPNDRIYLSSAGAGAELAITRDTGLYGSGILVRIYLDGKKAADFRQGEAFVLPITPGKHILGISPATTFGQDAVVESEIDVKPGDVIRRRITFNGGLQLTPTAYR